MTTKEANAAFLRRLRAKAEALHKDQDKILRRAMRITYDALVEDLAINDRDEAIRVSTDLENTPPHERDVFRETWLRGNGVDPFAITGGKFGSRL